MAHFANLDEVRALSEDRFCSMLTGAFGANSQAVITVNGCPVYIFVNTYETLESFLGYDLPFHNSKSYENIQIAAEFARKIWGRNLADMRAQ